MKHSIVFPFTAHIFSSLIMDLPDKLVTVLLAQMLLPIVS